MNHALGGDDVLRLHPSDWLPTLFDATDVERFLVEWVVPRLGSDVWLEDVDDCGPPDDWFELIEPRDIFELVDMVSVCKQRCAEHGEDFEQVLAGIRHAAYFAEGDDWMDGHRRLT